MKLCILYHPNDEHSTQTEHFAEECKRVSSEPVELISLETAEGANLASVYDIVGYPAMLVLRDDGQLNKGWQGAQFPTVEEVVGYLNN
jgi:hypothetical protein